MAQSIDGFALFADALRLRDRTEDARRLMAPAPKYHNENTMGGPRSGALAYGWGGGIE